MIGVLLWQKEKKKSSGLISSIAASAYAIVLGDLLAREGLNLL